MLATKFSAALVAALVLGNGAFAATVTPTSLTADCAGTTSITCGNASEGRRDLNNIEFYDTEADLVANGSFFSLGLGGSLTVGFGKALAGTSVIEITNDGSAQREAARVFGSTDGSAFTLIDTITNQTNSGTNQHRSTLSFAGGYSFLRFTDVSNNFVFADGTRNRGNQRSGDGFDIDAISITPAPVPLPAAGLLLMGGLAGFGALRKRRAA